MLVFFIFKKINLSRDPKINLKISDKFIASTNFNFDYVINAAFQDLNIVKMSMDKNGIPAFKMVATVDAVDTVTGGNYVFRNKASFSRINDKLGLQL